MTRLAVAVVLLLAAAHAPLRAGPGPAAPGRPEWLDRPQTYTMVPLLPETAARLHASVNGVWGGIGGAQPILSYGETVAPVRTRYGADEAAFVRACHAAGQRVFGVVNGLEGFAALRAGLPDMDAMACRDARGQPARVGDGMLLMCTNNPAWMQWRIARGKRAIDQGADAIQLDTPMSSAFESGFLRAGFCSYCMERFRADLFRRFTPAVLAARFGLTRWDARAVIARLSPLQQLSDPKRRPHHNTDPDDLLFREFIRCQEQASFDSCRRLVDTLRAYAASRRRKVAFAANASDLGTVNPGGHWIRALMFADLVDLFAYELNAEPAGMPSQELSPYPQGRWGPYHRLAYAVHRRRSPAVVHASSMGRLLMAAIAQGRSINTWMEVQSAEAYAANGAYIQYCVQPPGIGDLFVQKCWSGTARHAAFVQAHQDLYSGELRSGSSLAILFLLNERGRTIPAVCPSYLGFAQALEEGGYPFDVVFGGDGRYVRDRLAAGDLSPYRTVLVPSPIEPTASQQRVIKRFVKAGGTLVCQEPAKLGLPGAASGPSPAEIACVAGGYRYGRGRVLLLRGAVSPTWTDDAGSNYHRAYAPRVRAEIGRLAAALGLSPLLTADTGNLVTAFPIVQPGQRRAVVHLVNCDIDYERDAIRPKAGLALDLPRPAFLRRQVAARLLTPDAPDRTLSVRASGGRLSVPLPPLGVCATVVLSAR